MECRVNGIPPPPHTPAGRKPSLCCDLRPVCTHCKRRNNTRDRCHTIRSELPFTKTRKDQDVATVAKYHTASGLARGLNLDFLSNQRSKQTKKNHGSWGLTFPCQWLPTRYPKPDKSLLVPVRRASTKPSQIRTS